MINKEKLGTVIHATREKQKLTQQYICGDVIDRKTLYRIEHGMCGKESTYELILRKLNLAGIETYDECKVQKLITSAYNAMLGFDYDTAVLALEKILLINADNCILNCIKNTVNILIESYRSSRVTEENVDYLLSLLPAFSEELQILVLNYIYFKDRKLKTFNLEFCNKYLKQSNNPILVYDYIQYLIKYEQPLLALEICCKQIESLQNSNLFARVIRLYQTRYQLYRNLQPKYSYSAKNDMINYVNLHENELSSETLGDLYYNLGVNSIFDKNYILAAEYFQKSDSYSSPSLTSTICINFCNLKNGILEFKEYEISQNEYYPYVQFYKYLKLKNEMYRENNYDYIKLGALLKNIMNNNDEKRKSGVVYNLMNIESRELTKRHK